MVTCYTNCLTHYMDTQTIKLFIPSVPFYLPPQWNGNNILRVLSPFYLKYVGDDLVIDGPSSCSYTDASIVIDVTECTVNSFATEISTKLGLTKKMDIVVKDGVVCGWAEECVTEVNTAFEICAVCGCKVRGRAVLDDGLQIKGDGTTGLSDGMYTVFIQEMPDMNSMRYSPLIELMVRRQQQYRQGYTTSMTVNHGIESVQSARKIIDYDTMIEDAFDVMRKSKGVRIYRGNARSCKCRKPRFSKWNYGGC